MKCVKRCKKTTFKRKNIKKIFEFGKFKSYFACCLAAPFNFGAVRAYV